MTREARNDAGLRLLGVPAPRNVSDSGNPRATRAQPANPRSRSAATENPSTPRRPDGRPTCREVQGGTRERGTDYSRRGCRCCVRSHSRDPRRAEVELGFVAVEAEARHTTDPRPVNRADTTDRRRPASAPPRNAHGGPQIAPTGSESSASDLIAPRYDSTVVSNEPQIASEARSRTRPSRAPACSFRLRETCYEFSRARIRSSRRGPLARLPARRGTRGVRPSRGRRALRRGGTWRRTRGRRKAPHRGAGTRRRWAELTLLAGFERAGQPLLHRVAVLRRLSRVVRSRPPLLAISAQLPLATTRLAAPPTRVRHALRLRLELPQSFRTRHGSHFTSVRSCGRRARRAGAGGLTTGCSVVALVRKPASHAASDTDTTPAISSTGHRRGGVPRGVCIPLRGVFRVWRPCP